jgi:hypothetical protein
VSQSNATVPPGPTNKSARVPIAAARFFSAGTSGNHSPSKSPLASAQIGDQLGAVESLERLASIAIHGDDADRSAPLLGAAIALRKQLNTPLPSWRRSSQQEVEDVARHALGGARYEAGVREGTAMSLQDAATYAALELFDVSADTQAHCSR